jgi:FkbM family methyltransferase
MCRARSTHAAAMRCSTRHVYTRPSSGFCNPARSCSMSAPISGSGPCRLPARSAGWVLAIEPLPRSAAALESTLAANALLHAEIVRCAIGEHDGVAAFAVPVVTSARTDTGTARIGPACVGRDALQVRLRSLDSLAAERNLTRLDLIKIDVEGHERQVLDGAAAILDRHRPVLVIETGHEAEGDRAAVHDRLAGLGYRMLGILLDYGMASADWPAYVALDPPFCAGDAHNLLLVPDRVISRVSEEEPVPRRGRGPSRH